MGGFNGSILRILMAAGASILIYGCDTDKAQPVLPQDFYSRHTAAVSPISPLDRPGVIPLPDSHTPPPVQNPSPIDSSPESIGDDRAPGTSALATTEPSTMPSVVEAAATTEPTAQPVMATDQYMILGSVVEVVNGTPIYANKILRLDIDVLRNFAQQMDRNQFKIAAQYQIEKTLQELERDELEVAAAERTLDSKDIQLAHALTTLWSQNQVAEAGGSEQVARLRAAASGESFEDQEQDVYRGFLQKLYFVRKIEPEISVTVDDELRYYHAHIQEFTTPTEASIILIEADPQKYDGNADAAKAKLVDIRKRTLAGEDFADYAKRKNDLPGATGDSGNGGQITVRPNGLAFTDVEAQVWKTAPGQISDVIEDQGAYFLFKVVTSQIGGSKPFADRQVQETITKRLADVQRTQRREAEFEKLVAESITSRENVEPVVEMAMQNYSQWSKK
jgi:parvulin-like peptidyl-prolyl isomerase